MTDRITTSLVCRVIDGGEDDWERLVRLYSPSLERFMMRCRIPESDRDILRNDVFSEAFQGLTGFTGQNGSRSFLKWLWVIARRRVMRFTAKERRRPDRAVGGETGSSALAELPTEPTADDRAELLREILHARALSDSDSALLRQYYMEGLTAVQVGEQLGMTDVAVRQRVARLLRRIREQTDGLETW